MPADPFCTIFEDVVGNIQTVEEGYSLLNALYYARVGIRLISGEVYEEECAISTLVVLIEEAFRGERPGFPPTGKYDSSFWRGSLWSLPLSPEQATAVEEWHKRFREHPRISYIEFFAG